jgi:hypothetical protein
MFANADRIRNGYCEGGEEYPIRFEWEDRLIDSCNPKDEATMRTDDLRLAPWDKARLL